MKPNFVDICALVNAHFSQRHADSQLFLRLGRGSAIERDEERRVLVRNETDAENL